MIDAHFSVESTMPRPYPSLASAVWASVTRTRAVALLSAAGVTALCVAAPSTARAEGSDDVPQIRELLPETTVWVDILDEGEVMVYEGEWPAEVFAPDGTYYTTVLPGQTLPADRGTGAYSWRFGTPTTRISDFWDIEVPGRVGGRVWSYDWRMNSGTFRLSGALNRSFYALVDGGKPDRDGVVEMKADGFAGFVFRIAGTDVGLPGAHGRSVLDIGQNYEPEIPIYFEPPEKAQFNPLRPELTALVTSSVYGDCDLLVPGVNNYDITFESNISGTWHLICDINGDGVFNMVDDADLHRIGRIEEGENTIGWRGELNDGSIAAVGSYECIMRLAVGELHYVGYDVETVYPGFRFFDYRSGGARTGISMYWNDIEVQANDLDMPIGVPGPVTSGADGYDPGGYTDAPDPLRNARGWGRFTKGSKGDESWMDTYGWIFSVDSEVFTVNVGDGLLDTDGDTLLDVAEDCKHGTDPLLPDTDGDGLRDDREVRQLPTDPLNPDTDGDCLLDGEEVGETGPAPDFDGDGVVDPLDDDDDDDGISTRDEMCVYPVDGNPNYDGDQWDNHHDRDSDGDGWRDETEGTGDRDLDGNADFLDVDTVGVGTVLNAFYAGGLPRCAVGSPAPVGFSLLLLPLLRRRRRQS